MSAFHLEISDDVLAQARIDPGELEATLRRELAVQLYPSELTEEDLESDLRQLGEWRATGNSST